MAGNTNEIDQQSKSSFPFDDEDDQEFSKQYPASGSRAANNDFDVISDTGSVGAYQTKQSFYNNLEGSISLIEKTSTKLLPIW